MFLPGFNVGGFPNHLNRSSFIAPIARGRRKLHQKAEMVTRRDCVLEYSGEQLDEADGDLIMALVAFAQPYAVGTSVPLNRAKLLRKLTRSTGKHDYEWLHRRIKGDDGGDLVHRGQEAGRLDAVQHRQTPFVPHRLGLHLRQ
jgi:hypothetical protein